MIVSKPLSNIKEIFRSLAVSIASIATFIFSAIARIMETANNYCPDGHMKQKLHSWWLNHMSCTV